MYRTLGVTFPELGVSVTLEIYERLKSGEKKIKVENLLDYNLKKLSPNKFQSHVNHSSKTKSRFEILL